MGEDISMFKKERKRYKAEWIVSLFFSRVVKNRRPSAQGQKDPSNVDGKGNEKTTPGGGGLSKV